MRFPSKEKLKEMNEKLKSTKGTIMLPPDATPAQKFRWDLCRQIVKYMNETKISQVEMAKFLKIDPARLSEIVHRRISKVSTDKLLSYVEKIRPDVKYKIA